MHLLFQINLILFCTKAVHSTTSCEEKDQTLTCRKMTEMEGTDQQQWSVVLYEEDSIMAIHKQERRFSYLGHEFVIKQDWSKLGVAAVVWDAAEVLCEYLVHNPSVIRGLNVIELGAGTGLVGMVAALLGGVTTITDRETVLGFLRATIDDNLPGTTQQQVTVKALDWTDIDSQSFQTYDVILGADIVYIKEVFEDLLKTLVKLSDKRTIILLSCRIRYDRDNQFLSRLETLFNVEHILYDEKKDVNIYKAIKR